MDYEVEFVSAIEAIGESDWDALAGTDNPFTRYAFLSALEVTGCVGAETGWEPCHSVIKDLSGKVVALMPGYLKMHSYGEYVFDFAWAEAYQRHGLVYYPKWIVAIPFTPSVGPRLLMCKSLSAAQQKVLVQVLMQAVQTHCERHSISSWHLLFADAVGFSCIAGSGIDYAARLGCQYHWRNCRPETVDVGYENFDQFLHHLTSRKRKNIKKERQKVVSDGITFREVTGADITSHDIHQFYDFYRMTYLVRGQPPYLTEAFFQSLRSRMPEQMCLLFAMQKDVVIASALFLKSADKLFGRYWGASANAQRRFGSQLNFLHFETCYYQGIEMCIRHGLKVFDAGAQGEHKLLRGFEPVTTQSLHFVRHDGFRQAIGQFCLEESANVNAYIDDAKGYLPYKSHQ
jgi:hypothetical protein